jgi:hypothetical protein
MVLTALAASIIGEARRAGNIRCRLTGYGNVDDAERLAQ